MAQQFLKQRGLQRSCQFGPLPKEIDNRVPLYATYFEQHTNTSYEEARKTSCDQLVRLGERSVFSILVAPLVSLGTGLLFLPFSLATDSLPLLKFGIELAYLTGSVSTLFALRSPRLDHEAHIKAVRMATDEELQKFLRSPEASDSQKLTKAV